MTVTNLDDVLRAGLATLASVLLVTAAKAEMLETRIGELEFTQSFVDGYPTDSTVDKLGGLTFNATTPYVLPFIDLADGPWVLEMPGPAGRLRGAAHDMWQSG